jgi:phosphoribosylamine--glycine ligase
LLLAASEGKLAGVPRPEFSDDVAVTVVLASENYPDAPITGRAISGLEQASAVPGVTLAHAATAADGDTLVATGGRVLNVVAVAPDFSEARARAYEALGHIALEGAQFRTDIAAASPTSDPPTRRTVSSAGCGGLRTLHTHSSAKRAE